MAFSFRNKDINKIYYGTHTETIAPTNNVVEVGTITNTNGVYSGFTSSAYVKAPYSIGSAELNGVGAEINLCINVTFPKQSGNDMSILCNSSYNTTIFMRKSDYSIRIYRHTPPVIEGVIHDGTGIAQGDRIYIKVKLADNTNNISTIHALIGNNYTIDTLPSIESGEWTTFSNGTFPELQGTDNRICGGYIQSANQFKGSFDANNSNIIVNREEIWRGVTPGGTIEVGTEIKKVYLGDTLVYDNSETN